MGTLRAFTFFSSPSIATVISSSKMRWAGHVACIRETGYACRVSLENLKGRDLLEELDSDGRTTLKWIL
jgi:hypothetical protein